jgi:hypothetical protein
MRTLTRIATGMAVAAAAAMVALSGAATAAAAPPPAPSGEAAVQALQWDFYTGSVAAGSTRTYHWNNAPASSVYTVGLTPQGASTTQDCQFEVTRTWNVQNYGGEREFWFTVKNVGTIACGSSVMLYSMSDIAGAWNTGGVDPGAQVTKHWNNAGATSAYVGGAAPEGATSSAACQFEVVREWYQQQPSGEKEFWFTLRNTGTIACSAEVLLGSDSTSTVLATSAMGPGATAGATWNNNPDQISYIVGFTPSGATPATPCQFELTRLWHAQVINDNGSAEKELRYNYRNAGAITCSTQRLIAWAS